MARIWHMETIQVSRLKQYTNDVVDRVAEGRGTTSFSVTVHGRETDVVLVHRSQLRPDEEPRATRRVLIEDAPTSGLYDVGDQDTVRAMLDMVEQGRDASGTVGNRS